MKESKFDNFIKVVVIVNLLLLMFMSSANAQDNTVLNLGIGDDKYMHFIMLSRTQTLNLGRRT